ncbi:MAG: glycosyltransferase family 4 protein [Lentimicrobium sp.]|nr:glycosyltransferase family 4 protein [Lentimicrobium sp.]
MSKKVLFVHDGPIYTDTYGNYFGIHINDALRQRYLNLGVHVTFLIRVVAIKNKDLGLFTEIKNDNFSVIPFPNYKSFLLFFKNYYKARQIIKIAVKNHDIILSRLPSASGYEAAKFALKERKPCLVEYVACTFDAYWNYDWRGKLIAHYKMWQQKRLMKKVPYSIYVTKEFLQMRYPTNGQSIHCSNVELQPLNESALEKRLLKIEQTDFSRPLIVGTVAALNVPYKGQADVIKAIAKLKGQGNIFHYHLVGQGNPEKLIRLSERLGVADQIKIIGPLKHKEVFGFLESIDVYIQPSKTEGLPRALIEAMSKACPALGSKVGGIPELLPEEMTFQPGNIKEIAEKLLSLKTETLREQAIRNFKEAKHYEKDFLKKKRLDFYNKFLSETLK